MKLSLPLSVVLPRKKKADKKFILNLNVVRTTHYRTLAASKILYFDLVRAAIDDCPDVDWFGNDKVRVTYTLYPKTKRRVDLQNVCPIIAKFTEDALVKLGILTDDNSDIIVEVIYRFGKVDKENPRCELLIERTFDELKYTS